MSDSIHNKLGDFLVRLLQWRFPGEDLRERRDRPERFPQVVRYCVSKCPQLGVGADEFVGQVQLFLFFGSPPAISR